MERKFKWYVSGCYLSYTYLAGLKLDQIYKDYPACAKAFKVGRKRVKEVLGPEVIVGPPTCAPILYGHIICLGVPVTFQEDSEPGVRPIYKSIDEGISALKKEVDFSKNYLFKHYYGMWQYLKKEFPGESVSFSGFGWEGPITTAVLLSGIDFPEKAKEFLSLTTESIIKFVHFIKKINNEPPVSPISAGLCDDLSSLISPSLWDEFVIPYWEKYYSGLTTGKRYIHVENLNPEHLPFLEKVNLSHYDPSVSPALSPKIIKEKIDIPFGWRLTSFGLRDMSKGGVKEWVWKSFEEGAEEVFYILEKIACMYPEKISVFIETCKEIEKGVKNGKTCN